MTRIGLDILRQIKSNIGPVITRPRICHDPVCYPNELHDVINICIALRITLTIMKDRKDRVVDLDC